MATPAKYVRYRENVTADGRNLSREEWRVIPEFPKYQITSDGDIRHRETWRILKEQENKTTGAFFYGLWKDMPNGTRKSFSRGYQGLIWDAWPELKPAAKPSKYNRKYAPKGDWLVIPEFPLYQINREGTVRIKSNQTVIKSIYLDHRDQRCMKLTKDGKKHLVAIQPIVNKLFPEAWSEAA